MVNTDVMRQWVDALRSGDYAQTTSQLCKVEKETGAESFCCLGVLSELAVKAGVAVADTSHSDYTAHNSRFYRDNEGLSDGLIPPRGIRQWAGVSEWTGLRPEGLSVDKDLDEDDQPDEVELASLNDQFGYTFDQIADVIERTYL